MVEERRDDTTGLHPNCARILGGCQPCELLHDEMPMLNATVRLVHSLMMLGVVNAPAPARITPKGKFSDEFIIEVLARKYQQHLPIYRQFALALALVSLELWALLLISVTRP